MAMFPRHENSSRTSSRHKKQTSFYGSPIRHSVNLINSPVFSSQVPNSPIQVSLDKKVRFAKADQEKSAHLEHLRVCSPSDAIGYTRKFTRFPKTRTQHRITRFEEMKVKTPLLSLNIHYLCIKNSVRKL